MNRISELIYVYLDGEATDKERLELFEALGHNPDLQREFHQALQIHRAIDYERRRINTPVGMKESIYTAIGIAPTPSRLERILGLASISSAVGGILVGLTAWLMLIEMQVPSISNAPPPSSLIEIATPSTSAETLPNASKHFSSVHPVAHPYNRSQQESPTSPDESINLDDFTLDRRQTISSVAAYVHSIGRTGISLVHARDFPPLSTASTQLNMSAFYRGSFLASSGPATSLQNFSLVALFRFDEHNSLGLEFRRAPYALNIASPSSVHSTVPLSSIALVYRFGEPTTSILGGMPFVQPALGITQLGMLASMTAGLSFPISSHFHLSIGVDGSALLYSSQVTSNLGVAIGFNAGIPLR